MQDFIFSGISLKPVFYCINGTHNQSLRIDTDPIYVFFTLDFQEYVFINVTKISGMLRQLAGGNFQNFYKDISLEV